MARLKPMGRIARWFARVPIAIYLLGLGRLLGRRFVMIEHIGRVSGLPRKTVLEVVRRDTVSLDVAAAWGPRSDWFRNVVAERSVRVWSGRLRAMPATASVLTVDEAATVLDRYRLDHPRAARALGRIFGLGFDEPSKVASVVPMVRLTLVGG